MFLIMIMVVLMMMLKLMVFIDNRLVDLLFSIRMIIVNSSVKGIVVDMMSALCRSFRNSYWIRNIR